MSTFIHIDSTYRDRTNYPNPAEFTIRGDQTNGWGSLYRRAQCVRPCGKKEVCNMLFCLDGLILNIPATATNSRPAALGGPQPLWFEPFLYVHLSTERYNDKSLIKIANNFHSDAVFCCVLDRIQIDPDPNVVFPNNQLWLQYKCNNNQCIRLNDFQPIVNFRIFTREGTPFMPAAPAVIPPLGQIPKANTIEIVDTLPPNDPDPAVQVSFCIKVTPYVQSGDYDSQLSGLWTDN